MQTSYEIELKSENRCSVCGRPEEWSSLEKYGFPSYIISTLGKVLNVNTSELLAGGIHASGYRQVCLTNSEGKSKHKRINTLMGYAFY